MIKEFICKTTPGCQPFERRFANYQTYANAFSSGEVLCPVCKTVPEPVVSRTSPPKFNGSGFHTNDYRS